MELSEVNQVLCEIKSVYYRIKYNVDKREYDNYRDILRCLVQTSEDLGRLCVTADDDSIRNQLEKLMVEFSVENQPDETASSFQWSLYILNTSQVCYAVLSDIQFGMQLISEKVEK